MKSESSSAALPLKRIVFHKIDARAMEINYTNVYMDENQRIMNRINFIIG